LLEDLLAHIPQVGRLEWIGRAAGRRAEIEELETVELLAGTGLAGEHHANSGRSKRQVTLIQHEHLPVIAALTGRAGSPGAAGLSPGVLRRNLSVSGINLLALAGRRFRIGAALLEGTGPCAPCSRMEEQLGPGGFQAMRGHGGITAIVLEPAAIRRGDPVAPA